MARLRVLIAAFDGLQPFQVRPGLTPTIHRLASDGVTVRRTLEMIPPDMRTKRGLTKESGGVDA